MLKLKLTRVLPGILLLSAPALYAGTDDAVVSIDGLELVEKDRNGAIYAEPGVDWSHYEKIMLDDATVAFRKNWLRDQNRDRRSLSQRVSTSDVERIKSGLAKLFDEVFVEELTGGGWEIVDQAGPEVLRISPQIVDLDIRAPDVQSSTQVRSYTEQSGEMTLQLELYDSETGDLIAAARDHRESPYRGYMQWTNSITNRSDARLMLRDWAKALNERLHAATGKTPTD